MNCGSGRGHLPIGVPPKPAPIPQRLPPVRVPQQLKAPHDTETNPTRRCRNHKGEADSQSARNLSPPSRSGSAEKCQDDEGNRSSSTVHSSQEMRPYGLERPSYTLGVLCPLALLRQIDADQLFVVPHIHSLVGERRGTPDDIAAEGSIRGVDDVCPREFLEPVG